ncbi:hypothetical protein W822_18370 [Advenella kashmirensis W13003]|uniref:Uncharacterized protein n=1 Tax=Advenella kashmirensis W13003 TaxID=1424334 RepID=V8QPY8_9BURK|nr:hypothetical protein W822_18370 [Advenella kashmirensis W13003]
MYFVILAFYTKFLVSEEFDRLIVRVLFTASVFSLIVPGGLLAAQTITFAMGDDAPRSEGAVVPGAGQDAASSPLLPPAWDFDPEKTKIILLPMDEPPPPVKAGEPVPLEQLVTADALRGVDNWESYQYESELGPFMPGQNATTMRRKSSRIALKPVQSFSTGAQAWSLTTEDHNRISLGSNQVVSNLGQTGFRIGGMQLSRQPDGTQDSWFLDSNQLAYSTTAGAMDYSAASADNASFNFGSGAANTAVRFGLSDSASIDSQVQFARSMKNLGLGTSYALDDMGDLRLTVNAGKYEDNSNWRSMFAYRAKVFDLASLQFSNELTSAHYMDLSRLSQDPLTDRAIRNQLKLTYPLNTQSQMAGIFENSHVMNGTSEQLIGLEQSYKLDSVLLKLKAQRAVRSDTGSLQFNVNIPMSGK